MQQSKHVDSSKAKPSHRKSSTSDERKVINASVDPNKSVITASGGVSLFDF